MRTDGKLIFCMLRRGGVTFLLNRRAGTPTKPELHWVENRWIEFLRSTAVGSKDRVVPKGISGNPLECIFQIDGCIQRFRRRVQDAEP